MWAAGIGKHCNRLHIIYIWKDNVRIVYPPLQVSGNPPSDQPPIQCAVCICILHPCPGALCARPPLLHRCLPHEWQRKFHKGGIGELVNPCGEGWKQEQVPNVQQIFGEEWRKQLSLLLSNAMKSPSSPLLSQVQRVNSSFWELTSWSWRA